MLRIVDPLKCQEKVSVPVFRLPSAKDEQENRDNWINMLNSHDSEVKVIDNTVVCEKHWPRDYRKYRKKGHDRPADPPSIFGPIPEIHRLSLEVMRPCFMLQSMETTPMVWIEAS